MDQLQRPASDPRVRWDRLQLGIIGQHLCGFDHCAPVRADTARFDGSPGAGATVEQATRHQQQVSPCFQVA